MIDWLKSNKEKLPNTNQLTRQLNAELNKEFGNFFWVQSTVIGNDNEGKQKKAEARIAYMKDGKVISELFEDTKLEKLQTSILEWARGIKESS